MGVVLVTRYLPYNEFCWNLQNVFTKKCFPKPNPNDIFKQKNIRQKYNCQKIFWEKLKCADASAAAAAVITDEPLSFENFS